MNTAERTLPLAILGIIAAAIAVAAVIAAAMLLGGGKGAQATHVTPEFLAGSSNQGKTCGELEGAGQTWIEFKLEGSDLTDGAHSNGTLEVTISNLTNATFDWTSNIGVDGVVVKDGVDGANFYRYDPPTEETGDTGLGVPDARAISHISFCYDLPDATPTATPTPTPSATPAATPTAPPTAAPTATVLGEIQEPQTQQPQALPETGAEPPGGSHGYFPLLLAFGGLALLSGAGTLVAVAARRRR